MYDIYNYLYRDLIAEYNLRHLQIILIFPIKMPKIIYNRLSHLHQYLCIL